ncbi:LysR family transcriptional regulator [Burkholderia multivorans]|uniref:LysR family transcriptional regulator n=1 Tax=Burkholderia multivorans TaxID=87883 RepID=UPI001902D685|nr:LysR family transcriptional regulator [Burkholderia multivorans]MBJ9941789.1 LysR family transcriptional regulator [Burkholderia multivorans]MBU9284923.1 LysR family transcriptional regulator [Burkholderia multivorans]
MDNPIRAMRIFARIVEMNSFTRAALSLGISRATATRTVQELEAALGMPLLVRTTRALRTTPEGDAYYRRCRRITADVDELEASIRRAARHPSGPLGVDLPGPVASAIVLPALGTFHARHPDLVLMLGVSVRAADMVGDAVDCSVRLGELPDSSFVARPLGALERVTCASPAYLDRCGVPRTLDDLDRHRAVGSTSGSGQRAAECDFMVDGAVRKIRLDVIVGVDDEHAYLACGVHGLGLIQPPRAVAQPLIDAGLLREVLPQWRPAAVPVSAVYVKRPHVSPGVRAFVDWIAERFEAAARERAAGVIGWEARWRAPERIDMPVEGVSAAIA